ncbi:hypothetical protein [Archangium violaceum]|uniref:hypothetical protein n=1 Tax=Archangium violaceum TaxID=83451 RepID=UPI0036DB49DA
MKKTGLPVPLDRQLPFVRAVCDVMEERGELSAAIEALVAAEQRCGVAIWRNLAGDASQLGAGAFAPRDGTRAPSLRDVMELGRDWESFDKAMPLVGDDDPRSLALDEGLRRLLGETHLLLAGMDFTNEHFVRSHDGTLSVWTQRAWGSFLAGWANDVGWGPHFDKRGQRYSWKMEGFYHMDDGTLEQYGRWQDVVHEVLRQKTLRAVS